ncbi:hypothetical protein L249_3403 [Ophiocordyceps polyrhachis-furcata BCC 54312]|uniref:Probable 26S proteasome regulatory subunit p27 n=1 Tax=Ophiocordyceps polyrhachis-furcata BCC 54312 TaxID=1330021 RepID=A0A367LM68_9HYPO|nr:hypothetical protein L249_3403 [Ophiocordyceps polyrhachis-furcata BCC 54312]
MGLPLRMNSLHAPTVPSGSASTATTNNENAGRASFAELQRRKDDVEAELRALGGVLESHGVNMDTPILTRDGFPRADLDVAQIRTTRARIIRLRNDHKDVMTQIERFLHDHFANLDDTNETSSSSAARPLPDDTPDRPFARVNTVAPGSPAELAGLKAGDEIRAFGYVNQSNHDHLRKVAECVQGNEGQGISILVSRPAGAARRLEEMRLTLTPRRDWGGRGMLGCHILPL